MQPSRRRSRWSGQSKYSGAGSLGTDTNLLAITQCATAAGRLNEQPSRRTTMVTEQGLEWDVSWDTLTKEDCIFIDVGDETVTLTKADIMEMLEFMGEV